MVIESPHLPKRDVKSIRVVSRRFLDLCNLRFLNTVYVALRKQTLRVLVEISKHPVFSKTVKNIVYDATCFDALSRSQYDRLFYNDPHKLTKSFHSSREGIDSEASYLEHCKLYRQQEALKHDGTYIRIVKEALKRMPNVESFTMSELHSISNLEVRKDEIIRPRKWYLDQGPLRWDVSEALWPTDLPHMFEFWNPELDSDRITFEPFLEFMRIFSALSKLGKPIRKLNIWPWSWASAPCASLPFQLLDLRQVDLQRCCTVFRGLNSLELSLQIILNQNVSTAIQNLQTLLVSAPNLVNLVLHINSDGSDLSGDLSKNFFDSLTWPHLRSLELTENGATKIEYTAMRDLLLRHGGTLKELKLHRVLLKNGSWENLFREFRCICVLDGAHLRWIDDDEVDVYEYNNDIGFCLGLEYLLCDGKSNSLGFADRHRFLVKKDGDWVYPDGVTEVMIDAYIEQVGPRAIYRTRPSKAETPLVHP